jgi:hypothetical protein
LCRALFTAATAAAAAAAAAPSGKELRAKGLNRIGNMLVPNSNYCLFEDWIMPLLDDMLKQQQEQGTVWTPSKVGQAGMRRSAQQPAHVVAAIEGAHLLAAAAAAGTGASACGAHLPAAPAEAAAAAGVGLGVGIKKGAGLYLGRIICHAGLHLHRTYG